MSARPKIKHGGQMGTLSMAGRGFVFSNKLFYMNLFRCQQLAGYRCRSLVAIR
jgi:hypothetical protein